jgi:hypothetical protein
LRRSAEAPVPTEHEKVSTGAQTDEAQARKLATAALAYAGAGIRRLDRIQAGAYLPFEIE